MCILRRVIKTTKRLVAHPSGRMVARLPARVVARQAARGTESKLRSVLQSKRKVLTILERARQSIDESCEYEEEEYTQERHPSKQYNAYSTGGYEHAVDPEPATHDSGYDVDRGAGEEYEMEPDYAQDYYPQESRTYSGKYEQIDIYYGFNCL